MCRHALVWLILTGSFLWAAPAARADLRDLIKEERRKILFLGDSNTYSGLYIAYVEGYLRTRHPDVPWELINLGLPSETLSGLSEPDHPYPRPNVHTRIDRALTKIKPKVVFVCYGMNDGIYHPLSDDRLAKYKDGTEKLVAKIEKAGAKVILMTPAPFDGSAVKKNLLPKDAPKFSWMKPYEKYDDEVLRKYSDYLLEWRKKEYTVVDAHAAVTRFLKAMRAEEPAYKVSGDGIHPNPTGHAVIAFEILRELKAPTELANVEVDVAQRKISGLENWGKSIDWGKDMTSIRASGAAGLLPVDARWDKRVNAIEKYDETYNRLRLKVRGLSEGKHEITGMNRAVLATATHDELARGILIACKEDPNRKFKLNGKELPPAIFACDMLVQRQRLLGPAWLDDVGHNRPDTPKGLPLEKAKGQADELMVRFRLAQAMVLEVNIQKKE